MEVYLLTMLEQIAGCEVANRPGRLEPRVLKRRRHGYKLMMKLETSCDANCVNTAPNLLYITTVPFRSGLDYIASPAHRGLSANPYALPHMVSNRWSLGFSRSPCL